MFNRIKLTTLSLLIVVINIVVAFYAQLVIIYSECSIIRYYTPNVVKYLLNDIENGYIILFIGYFLPISVIICSIVMVIIKKYTIKHFLTQSLFLVVVLVCIFSVTNLMKLKVRNYDRDIWISEICVRKYMIEDIKDNHIISGMSKDNVIQLLGEPDYDEGDRIGYNYGEYILGNYDIYVISFENDIVTSH